MNFNDVSIVVTGAGSGIGRGIVDGFIRDGAIVTGIGRSESALEETKSIVNSDRFEFVTGDISKLSDVSLLFEQAKMATGKVDVLINNAAIYPKVKFVDADMDEWAEVINVNVVGAANCCKFALSSMVPNSYGRIVNIGSFAFLKPIPQASAYSVSKGALNVLTRSIACELEASNETNILINELMPGVYGTRMTPESDEDPANAYQYVRNIVSFPEGGHQGQTFLKNEIIVQEKEGIKTRLKNLIKSFMP